MRGNHRIWGRQDYDPPPPMCDADRARVDAVSCKPVEGTKTWQAVFREHVLLGYVTRRLVGYQYRLPNDEGWRWVANVQNEADPFCGTAILALLRHLSDDTDTPQVN